MKIRLFPVAVLGVLLFLCAQAQAAKTLSLSIGKAHVSAEVAATEQTRELGLMHRRSMASHAGMLFVFDAPDAYCFWMKNTLIPLSIAFIDGDGVIVNIDDMAPQTETNHCATKPAKYALEMNQGWFQQNRIGAGAKVRGITADTGK
jgi:uncharacterized protein